jgi:hypothetical protein
MVTVPNYLSRHHGDVTGVMERCYVDGHLGGKILRTREGFCGNSCKSSCHNLLSIRECGRECEKGCEIQCIMRGRCVSSGRERARTQTMFDNRIEVDWGETRRRGNRQQAAETNRKTLSSAHLASSVACCPFGLRPLFEPEPQSRRQDRRPLPVGFLGRRPDQSRRRLRKDWGMPSSAS